MHDVKSVEEADSDLPNGPAVGGHEPGMFAPLCVLSDKFDGSDGERKLAIVSHIPSGTTKT